MSVRQEVLTANRALLNGRGKISYFERRGISAETIARAYVGYENGAFTYPSIAKEGRLLGVHYKSEGRDAKGKRRQWWGIYAADLPSKGYGERPDEPARIIPFGLETLKDLAPGSRVFLCCGEEDALSLRQAGYPALSQPGAGLLEPVYARDLAGLHVTVFYDAGEEIEARKDALKLERAGAESISVVKWPADAPHGADINGRLVEESGGFGEWVAGMIAAADSPSQVPQVSTARAGRVDRYGVEGKTSKGTVLDPVGQLLSEVAAEKVSWLWGKRLPLGKLTILDGDPGLGKSALLTDAAARVSVGRSWPDGAPCVAGGVVICSAEDGLADTVRPRLDAAGGDPSKVLALATVQDGHGERLLSIPGDLNIIRAGIERIRAKLVIVDPILAFLSGSTDSHKDQDVRRALAPIAKLAEETGAAVVVVRHLNQASGGNPLYRGQGSIGIIGAARSALLVAKDPEDDRRRVLAPLKSNLAKPAPSLAFTLVEAANGAVRVEYGGKTNHSADTLLAPMLDPEERSALGEAKDFLRDTLQDGPRYNKDVRKEAKEADISEATLKRAKTALGVLSKKEEGDGAWRWILPEAESKENEQEGQQDEQDPQALTGEHLEHLEPLPVDEPIQGDQGGQQGAQALKDEHLGESPIGKLDSTVHGGQDAQGVQGAHQGQAGVGGDDEELI